MAEFGVHAHRFEEAGYDLAAISGDDPERSAVVRARLRLTFPILCDTDRNIIREWGLLNPRIGGGVAEPAVYVIREDRSIRLGSVDTETRRVRAPDLLAVLSGAQPGELRRRWIVLRPIDGLRAWRTILRFGMGSPGPSAGR